MASIEQSKSFTMFQPIDIIFPLLSPEGEKAWVPGWDYRSMGESKLMDEDYIFTTMGHDHGTTQAIWIVKKYLPGDYFVQFYKVEPGDKVGVVSVKCEKLSQLSTRIIITYKYTGLSPKGNEFVAGYSKEKHDTFILEWESLLTAYFNTLS